jgi:hypothetical protein
MGKRKYNKNNNNYIIELSHVKEEGSSNTKEVRKRTNVT